MYGKTYSLHSSPALAPAEAVLVSSSLAFDRLHDDLKDFILPMEVIKEKATIR